MNANPKFHKKITVLGGGTGQFNLLRGLVSLNDSSLITAIPGTWDSGGSSGRLRTELGILPPGDTRQCLIALMDDPDQQEVAIATFNDRSFNSHALGNLIIATLEKIYHGQYQGLEKARKLFFIKGRIAPSALNDLELNAVTEKGIELCGEEAIDHNSTRETFDPTDKIETVYFSSPPEANPEAIKAIKEADLIVLSSGSLYNSILPHLLIDEVKKAILKSKAPLIFVLNLMTEPGQTDFYKASDHLKPLIKLLGKDRINFLIVNENNLDKEVLEIYEKEGQEPVEIDTKNCQEVAPNLKIISDHLASYSPSENLLRHDPEKLASVILGLD